LSVDTLKVDRSVSAVAEDPDNAAMVHAMVTLAHDLDLRVVAEGIESESEFLFKPQSDLTKSIAPSSIDTATYNLTSIHFSATSLAGPLFAASDLPEPTAAERRPPSNESGDSPQRELPIADN
jgi:hypothetical protein